MTILSEDPTPIPYPEYVFNYTEPEYIDLTPAIEPGEDGYRDPDAVRLSGIIQKIDRLISLTDTIMREVTI